MANQPLRHSLIPISYMDRYIAQFEYTICHTLSEGKSIEEENIFSFCYLLLS